MKHKGNHDHISYSLVETMNLKTAFLMGQAYNKILRSDDDMDRITVMGLLEGLTDSDWSHFHSDSEVQNIASEALLLLKEDCHNCKLECLLQKYDQLKEKYDKLLKEQEAIEPITYHRSDGTIFKYECRQCRTKIFKMDLFCRHCGRKVKWE